MPITLHDISVPVGPGMLHYGRQPEKTMVESIANGDDGNVSRWLIGSHTGTHLDAPAHFRDGMATIEQLPVELMVGPARVLDLTFVEGSEVTADDLRRAGLGDDERVLLRTRNSTGALRETVKSPWVGIDAAAAELLLQRGVRLVAIDYLTIDSPAGETGWPVHNILCPAGVCILEVVDLSAVEAGEYTLAALPVKLVGSEAAPARAVLIRGLAETA
ncbi:MAG TPA: cyclase family protein [Conexibacter sp.]|nr:cyclase family protein [Conexibacter sp.]